MPSKYPEFFLGRQPIFDRSRKLAAYELLYRSGPEDRAHVTDDAAATRRVVNRLCELGIQTALGRCKGFINVDASTLMSGAIESLPSDRVVIELLETIEVDSTIVGRCRELKAKGYRLALDDFFRYGEEYEPLLRIVDIVKIDVLMLDDDALAKLVKQLRLWPPRLLAEKVESVERARQCLKLGFNLFQGFFFGRPALLAT
jgi:c-di-GMP-related signal transduction protein